MLVEVHSYVLRQLCCLLSAHPVSSCCDVRCEPCCILKRLVNSFNEVDHVLPHTKDFLSPCGVSCCALQVSCYLIQPLSISPASLGTVLSKLFIVPLHFWVLIQTDLTPEQRLESFWHGLYDLPHNLFPVHQSSVDLGLCSCIEDSSLNVSSEVRNHKFRVQSCKRPSQPVGWGPQYLKEQVGLREIHVPQGLSVACILKSDKLLLAIHSYRHYVRV